MYIAFKFIFSCHLYSRYVYALPPNKLQIISLLFSVNFFNYSFLSILKEIFIDCFVEHFSDLALP